MEPALVRPQDKQTLKVVNGYTIKNVVLGKGSSATTYLCIKNDQLIACKMIKKSNLDQKIAESKEKDRVATREYILESLKKQINNWKKLNHQNIVKFLDIAETTNNLYFFLQYCDSNDLAAAIKKGLSYKQGLKYLFDIAKGIAYLYQQGVYHRDLKPENILIHNGKAKIADFGFSKVIADAEQRDEAQQQTMVGTPNYMAVQVLQASEYSIKCDIWSFGVMAYKMFYGVLPWGDVKDLAHLKKIIKVPIKFPTNKEIPKQLQQLLSKMIVAGEQNRLNAMQAYEMIKKMHDKVYGPSMQQEI